MLDIEIALNIMNVPRRDTGSYIEDTFPNGGILSTLFNDELYNGDPVLPSGLSFVLCICVCVLILFFLSRTKSTREDAEAQVPSLASCSCTDGCY